MDCLTCEDGYYEPLCRNCDIEEWISVKDRLPKDQQMIAVCIDYKETGCVCRFCENSEEKLPCLIYGPLKILGFTWKEVTHWIPLPLPPTIQRSLGK